MAAVLEQVEAWGEAFESGWRAHLDATGRFDWSQYPRPRNTELPPSPGVDLARSRLLILSSAGAYDPSTQEAFLGDHPMGDYGIRELPTDVDLADLAYAHGHYDHTARRADPGVLLPHALLQERVQDGRIGALTPSWISFMGYMPDLRRLLDETVPRVIEVALREHADCALLVPS